MVVGVRLSGKSGLKGNAMESPDDSGLSRRTRRYKKLKLIAATACYCYLSVLLLVLISYHGTEIEDTMREDGFMLTVTGLMLASAVVSLVRVPRDKGNKRQKE